MQDEETLDLDVDKPVYSDRELQEHIDSAWNNGVEWAIEFFDRLETRYCNLGLTPEKMDIYNELFDRIRSELNLKFEAAKDESKITALRRQVRELGKEPVADYD